MKVLQVHNQYVRPGGEDMVLELERGMLRSRGHDVHQFLASNAELRTDTFAQRVRTGVEAIWSGQSYRALLAMCRRLKPDVMHVHNTFARLSPSIFWAAHRAGVPVVLTLHNYRFVCSDASLMRDSRPCELCVGRAIPLPALKYRCYRGSLSATASIAATQVVHRALRTYARKVHAIIALTPFARELMIRAGLPEASIHVKPQSVPDPLTNAPPGPSIRRDVVFLGRITQEKGLDLLLQAWKQTESSEHRLLIVGDGPDRARLQQEYRHLSHVEWHGWVPHAKALGILRQVRFVVISSRCYEGFPMTVVEALASGTPAIVPAHGGFPSIVGHQREGLHFAPGNASALADALTQGLDDDGDAWHELSRNARRAYEQSYSPETNYERLMAIYEYAVAHARGVEPEGGPPSTES